MKLSSCFVSLVEYLVVIVTRRAKDLADRHPKNSILSSTGTVIQPAVLLAYMCLTLELCRETDVGAE